jgi:SAM-dependent methyltransferase
MLWDERVPELEASDRHDEAPELDAARRAASDRECVAQAIALGVAAGRALDVGCGSGRRAILLASLAERMRVVGVDSSWALIARALTAAREAGVAGRCTFVRADPKRLPLVSRRFDLVLCDGLLHHLDAALPALNEVERTATLTAAIFLRDLRRPRWLHAGLSALWLACGARRANPAHAASLRAAFTTDELADLVRRSRLRGVRVESSGLGHVVVVRRASHDR